MSKVQLMNCPTKSERFSFLPVSKNSFPSIWLHTGKTELFLNIILSPIPCSQAIINSFDLASEILLGFIPFAFLHRPALGQGAPLHFFNSFFLLPCFKSLIHTAIETIFEKCKYDVFFLAYHPYKTLHCF